MWQRNSPDNVRPAHSRTSSRGSSNNWMTMRSMRDEWIRLRKRLRKRTRCISLSNVSRICHESCRAAVAIWSIPKSMISRFWYECARATRQHVNLYLSSSALFSARGVSHNFNQLVIVNITIPTKTGSHNHVVFTLNEVILHNEHIIVLNRFRFSISSPMSIYFAWVNCITSRAKGWSSSTTSYF